jgi:hypothetical protein
VNVLCSISKANPAWALPIRQLENEIAVIDAGLQKLPPFGIDRLESVDASPPALDAGLLVCDPAQRPNRDRPLSQRGHRKSRLWDAATSVTADGGTDSVINRLCDVLAEVGDPATRGVEFRIDQFNLLNHDSILRVVHNLGDSADVSLTEYLLDGGATSITEGDAAAESHTNLQANARLYDDIAEVEEPARHRLEFRIDRFTHLLRRLHVNVWLKASHCLARVWYRRVAFLSVTEITGTPKRQWGL